MTSDFKGGIDRDTDSKLQDMITTLEGWQGEATMMVDGLDQLMAKVADLGLPMDVRDDIMDAYEVTKRKLVVLYDAACEGTHWAYALQGDIRPLLASGEVE